MNLLKYLFSKVFLKNVLIAAIISIVLLGGVFLWLFIFTRHNQSIIVPDFSGLKQDEVEIIADSKDLRFEIVDSIFYKELPKGTVAKQNPRPGSKVKQNRRIYLTMNAVNPEKVTMPAVTGVSLRQARAILETSGLFLGKLSYKPDIAINVVLEQKHSYSIVEPGSLITKGSDIDLVLGQGLSRETTIVPNLIGFNLMAAKEFLADRYLNIGSAIYDESIEDGEDSTNCFIWKQDPEFNEENRLQLGSDVYLWLTVDSTLLPEPDSLLLEDGSEYPEDIFNEALNP